MLITGSTKSDEKIYTNIHNLAAKKTCIGYKVLYLIFNSYNVCVKIVKLGPFFKGIMRFYMRCLEGSRLVNDGRIRYLF